MCCFRIFLTWGGHKIGIQLSDSLQIMASYNFYFLRILGFFCKDLLWKMENPIKLLHNYLHFSFDTSNPQFLPQVAGWGERRKGLVEVPIQHAAACLPCQPFSPKQVKQLNMCFLTRCGRGDIFHNPLTSVSFFLYCISFRLPLQHRVHWQRS